MRVVIQRVLQASVSVAGTCVGRIDRGLLVLLGIARTDTVADAEYLAGKTIGLRIFPDSTGPDATGPNAPGPEATGKMNRTVIEAAGSLLVVPQFTLYGDCTKGMRPSFSRAAPPEQAQVLYHHFVNVLRSSNVAVATGVFQEHMEVTLVNDGPVTIICESKGS